MEQKLLEKRGAHTAKETPGENNRGKPISPNFVRRTLNDGNESLLESVAPGEPTYDESFLFMDRETWMTRNPIYDYPEPYANPRREALMSGQNISLVGRLRLTQAVWLQLGINSATALHILQREPPGTFLVRRSNTRQCQVLCLRLPDISSPAFVTTYRLHQDRAVTWLEGSDLTFPSLLHLIASYCSIPDILPLSLRLPRPIWEASSCQQLEAIAHLGLEFWSSSLNTKELDIPTPLALPSGVDADSGPAGDDRTHAAEPAGRTPTNLSNPPWSGPLRGDVGVRRQYFKNHVKVQVSTEAASPLSPPAAPPPPIPVGKKMKKNPRPSPTERSQPSNPSPWAGVSSQAAMKREDYRIPQTQERVSSGHPRATLNPPSSLDQPLQVMEEEQPELRDQTAELGHFRCSFPVQENLGHGGRDHGLSFSGPS